MNTPKLTTTPPNSIWWTLGKLQGKLCSMNLNKAMADEVARVLRERNWTLRAAAEVSGLPHTTIFHMSQGRNVRIISVKKWAEAINESPYHWVGLTLKPYLSTESQHELPALTKQATKIGQLFDTLDSRDQKAVESLLEVLAMK